MKDNHTYYHKDTLRLKIGHLILLPIIILIRMLRIFFSFRINIGWVYTGSGGKQRYFKVGAIDFKRLSGIHDKEMWQ